jgi:pilus assembly protein Flp/PilA
MRNLFLRFLTDRSGATSIEYALIASGIALVIMSTVFALGPEVAARYSNVKDALAQQNP